MNERIKELVKQAGGHFSTHTLTSNPVQYRESVELWDDNIEKFAELIVRECADLFDKDEIELTLTERTIHSMIKEHFGVEELPVCKHDWYSAKNPVVLNGSVCLICGAIDAREPEELKNERTN